MNVQELFPTKFSLFLRYFYPHRHVWEKVCGQCPRSWSRHSSLFSLSLFFYFCVVLVGGVVFCLFVGFFVGGSGFGSVKTKHTQLILSFWSITQVTTLSWWINHVFYPLCQTQYTIYSLANKLLPPKKASHTVSSEFSTLPSPYNVSVPKKMHN